MTPPLRTPLVCSSTGLDCIKTAADADKMKATVRAMNLSDMAEPRRRMYLSGLPTHASGGGGLDSPSTRRNASGARHSKVYRPGRMRSDNLALLGWGGDDAKILPERRAMCRRIGVHKNLRRTRRQLGLKLGA